LSAKVRKQTGAKRVVDPTRQPGLRISQVYLSHARFHYVADPLTLLPPPVGTQVPMNVKIEVVELEQNSGSEVAAVRVRVRSDEGSSHPYIFDVSMGAIVETEGEANYRPKDYVLNAGAALLYPFVREAIANITQRGRFGAVWIPPFNVQMVTQNRGG
jgi:preprotein translocase subunit SecB